MHRQPLTTIIVIAATIAAAITATARTRTTQSQLRDTRTPLERMAPATEADSAAGVSQTDVTLRGYSKRASDAKESFFITNHTPHRISAVRLLLRYTTMQGHMLHERAVTVPVSLGSGQSQLVSIATFDVQRLFYYYAGPKPRKQATPFRVSYRLTGYDIAVGR